MTNLVVINKEEFTELLKEQLTLILKSHENNRATSKDVFPNKLCTRKEAANYLRISLPTLGTWTKQ